MELHWWKVNVTMLKDRKKGQRSKFGSAPAPVEPAEQIFWSFFGGIPPVKWRHLANRSCTGGAIRRIDSALVASYYLKWRLLADRSYISVTPPPLRTSHELVVSKFVRLIFKVAPSDG